jgi:hypothetical protein
MMAGKGWKAPDQVLFSFSFFFFSQGACSFGGMKNNHPQHERGEIRV